MSAETVIRRHYRSGAALAALALALLIVTVALVTPAAGESRTHRHPGRLPLHRPAG
jgi:hypothetical protein